MLQPEMDIERLKTKLASYLSLMAADPDKFLEIHTPAAKAHRESLREVGKYAKKGEKLPPSLKDKFDQTDALSPALITRSLSAAITGQHKVAVTISPEQLAITQEGNDVQITITPTDAENARKLYDQLQLMEGAKIVSIAPKIPVNERFTQPDDFAKGPHYNQHWDAVFPGGGLAAEARMKYSTYAHPSEPIEAQIAKVHASVKRETRIEEDKRGPFKIILPDTTLVALDKALTEYQSRREDIGPAGKKT